tara:strand:- start:522 stop:722 length:201 start_codon:yes stop_codon:yes gene_type:complete
MCLERWYDRGEIEQRIQIFCFPSSFQGSYYKDYEEHSFDSAGTIGQLYDGSQVSSGAGFEFGRRSV